TCVFSTMVVGTWNNGTPTVETKPAKLTLGFDQIDTEDGTARVIGTFGPSDIVVKLSDGTLHFMQSFREGPLYTTTIFPHESRPGKLKAVHTRHEYTEVSLPAFTSRPEQYYGECDIVKRRTPATPPFERTRGLDESESDRHSWTRHVQCRAVRTSTVQTGGAGWRPVLAHRGGELARRRQHGRRAGERTGSPGELHR